MNNTRTKTKAYIKLYTLISTVIMVIMFASPLINNKIYAETASEPKEYKSILPGVYTRSGDYPVADGAFKDEAIVRNELYDSLRNERTELNALNLAFGQTRDVDLVGNRYISKEMLGIDLKDYMINEGKLYDPLGKEKLDNARSYGYTYHDLYNDPGAFCIEWGAPLPGAAQESLAGFGSQLEARFGSRFRNNDIVEGFTDYLNGITKPPKGQVTEEVSFNSNLEHNHNIGKGDLERYLVEKGIPHQIKDGKIVFEDKEKAEKALKDFREQFSETITTDTLVTGNNAIDSQNIGFGQSIHTGNRVEPEKTGEEETRFTDDDAAVAFYASSYAQRRYGDDTYHTIQWEENSEATWPGDIQQAIYNDLNINIGRPGNFGGTGGQLFFAGQEFQTYWNRMKEFEKTHPDFPRDGYQLLHYDQQRYHKDYNISKMPENPSAPSTPDRITIKNPKVRYEPRVLPGDGFTMEESSVVNFDADKQIWLIGPYKIDYLMAGTTTPLRGEDNTPTQDAAAFRKYFSALTKVSLKGKYSDGTRIDRVSGEEGNVVQNAIGAVTERIPEGTVSATGETYVKRRHAAVAEDANIPLGSYIVNNNIIYKVIDVLSKEEYPTIGKTQDSYHQDKVILNDDSNKIGDLKIIKPEDAEYAKAQEEYARSYNAAMEKRWGRENKTTESGLHMPEISPDLLDPLAGTIPGDNTDPFGVEAKDKEEGLSEVKSWRLRINRSADGYGPGMVSQKDPSLGIPAPMEEFFFEIDYDPALESINKARFEFAYTIYGGYLRKYSSYALLIRNIKVDVTSNVDTEETEDGVTIKDDPSTETRVTGEAGETPTQSLASVDSARWIERILLEINFKEKERPGYRPRKKGLKLRLPIGGRVWEDRHENVEKHNGYDHIYTEGSNDLPLEGIKVSVFRNLMLDGNVIDRQYARLFDIDTGKRIDEKDIYTDAEGRWGIYHIHDLGLTEEEVCQTKGKGIISFDVRYDYDGLKYEAVLPMRLPEDSIAITGNEAKEVMERAEKFQTSPIPSTRMLYTRSSMVFENPYVRDWFNTVNARYLGSKPIDSEGNTEGRVSAGLFTQTQDKNIQAEPVHHNTGNEEAPVHEWVDNERIKEILTNDQYGNAIQSKTLVNKDDLSAYEVPADYQRTVNYKETQRDSEVNNDKVDKTQRIMSEYIEEIPANKKDDAENKYRFMSASTHDLGLLLPATRQIRMGDKTVHFRKISVSRQEFCEAVTYMTNLNMGLKRRAPADVAISKDLHTAMVTVNKKAYNYSYNSLQTDYLTDEEKQTSDRMTIDLGQYTDRDKAKVQQVLDIYKTDYIYRTSMYNMDQNLGEAITEETNEEKALDEQAIANGEDKDPRALDVFITYRIEAINRSPVDVVNIDAIDDYHTNKMELVNKKIVKMIELDPRAGENIETAREDKTIQLDRKEIDIASGRYLVGTDLDNQREVPVNGTTPIGDLPKANVDEKDKANTNVAADFEVERLFSSEDNPYAGIELAPKETAHIYATYRVRSIDDIRDLTKPDEKEALGELRDNSGITKLSDALRIGDFANVAEIAMFNTRDALSGRLSAKYDETSAPDNFNAENLGTDSVLVMEDDTDNAPMLNVRIPEKNEAEPRKLNGIVWEDLRTVNNKGIYTGDGIFDPTKEKGIPNMPVTLEERVSLKADNPKVQGNPKLVFDVANNGAASYVDIPFIWPNKIVQPDIEIDLFKLTEFKSNIATDQDGNYNFTGVPAGNFVVSMDYTSPNAEKREAIFNEGDNQAIGSVTAIQNADIDINDLVPTVESDNKTFDREVAYYNGIDFKNTMFYAKGGNANTNNRLADSITRNPVNVDRTWLDKNKEGMEANSYLRDDEIRRVEVAGNFETYKSENTQLLDIFRRKNDEIVQNEFDNKLKLVHEKSSMRATTPKMNFSIEYYEKLGEAVKTNPGFSIMEEYKDLYAVDGNYKAHENTHATPLYNVSNINMGLVERPEAKVVLNKEITNIVVTTSDGDEKINAVYDVVADINTDADKTAVETKYGESRRPLSKITLKRKLNEEKSVGADNILSLDRTSMVDGTVDHKENPPADLDQLKNGYRYINIDESLMQDATINIRYGIYGYNLSEIDRKVDSDAMEKYKGEEALIERERAYRRGKDFGDAILEHQLKPDISGYGRFVGIEYYMLEDDTVDENNPSNGSLPETDISDVEIKEVIDIVDNSTTVDLGDDENSEWVAADKTDLIGLVQNVEESNANNAEYMDGNGERYITNVTQGSNPTNTVNPITGTQSNSNTPKIDPVTLTTITNTTNANTTNNATTTQGQNTDDNIKSNIFLLKEFSASLKPFELLRNGDKKVTVDLSQDNEAIAKWTIRTDRTISEQSDSRDLSFENIVELIGYSTDGARRDKGTPGNLITTLDKYNGYGNGEIPGNGLDSGSEYELNNPDKTIIATAAEHDSASTELVTLSPPTGIGLAKKANTLSVIFVASLFAIIISTITIITKKSGIYDIDTTKKMDTKTNKKKKLKMNKSAFNKK